MVLLLLVFLPKQMSSFQVRYRVQQPLKEETKYQFQFWKSNNKTKGSISVGGGANTFFDSFCNCFDVLCFNWVKGLKITLPCFAVLDGFRSVAVTFQIREHTNCK